MARYEAGAYSKLQFLRAISDSLGMHSAGFLAEVRDDDDYVCLLYTSPSPRDS